MFFFGYMDFLNLLRVAGFFSVIWTLGYIASVLFSGGWKSPNLYRMVVPISRLIWDRKKALCINSYAINNDWVFLFAQTHKITKFESTNSSSGTLKQNSTLLELHKVDPISYPFCHWFLCSFRRWDLFSSSKPILMKKSSILCGLLAEKLYLEVYQDFVHRTGFPPPTK